MNQNTPIKDLFIQLPSRNSAIRIRLLPGEGLYPCVTKQIHHVGNETFVCYKKPDFPLDPNTTWQGHCVLCDALSECWKHINQYGCNPGLPWRHRALHLKPSVRACYNAINRDNPDHTRIFIANTSIHEGICLLEDDETEPWQPGASRQLKNVKSIFSPSTGTDIIIVNNPKSILDIDGGVEQVYDRYMVFDSNSQPLGTPKQMKQWLNERHHLDNFLPAKPVKEMVEALCRTYPDWQWAQRLNPSFYTTL